VVNETDAALWRAKAVSLRRAADAIDEMVNTCERASTRQPSVRARILAMLSQQPEVTITQIKAVIIHVKPQTIHATLCKMVCAGQVRRVRWGTYALPTVGVHGGGSEDE
jgi:predicted transcriptional regulator of viral defense system